VTGINRPPVFTTISLTQTAMYGLPASGFISATDTNVGDTLTYSKLTGPTWLNLGSNGSITGTPTIANLGINVFSVRVTDAGGAVTDGTLNVSVIEPTLYFDVNGSDVGSAAGGAVTWSDVINIWSGSVAGTTATQPWVSGGLAILSAGTGGGNTNISVTGNQNLRGLSVEEGSHTLSGGAFFLSGSTPTFTIGSGLGVSVSSTLTGMTGMRHLGNGTLTIGGSVSNTYTGATSFANNGQFILSKTDGAVAIPGDLLMAAPGVRGIVSTTLDNQFAPGSVLRFTSTGDARLELKGTTQTLGGIENSGVAGFYHCVQHSEFGTPPAVDASSQLILDVAGANAFTFNTAVGSLRNQSGGVLSLVKTGTGTQTLSGGNVSYTGATTINAGRLVFGGTYGSTSLIVASGATLELNVASSTTDYATSTLSGTGTLLKTGTGSARWGTQAGTFAFGAGGLVDVRAGTLIASSSNNENWSMNLSSLNVNSGATINGLTFGASVFDALTGGGIVQGSGTNTLTIGANNTAAGIYNTTAGVATFSGVISSVSSLIKTGTGEQTLSGANTYTGSTAINQGSLIVSGSLANTAINVGSAGTLGGTGSIAGSVSVNGTLSPGVTGPGNLAVTNTLTLASGSRLLWEISNWTGSAGTHWDRTTVNALILTATSANPITIRPADLALVNFTEANRIFTLLQTTTGISGFDPNKFSIDTTGLTLPKGTWAVQQSGNNLMLSYTRFNNSPVFAINPIAITTTRDIEIAGVVTAVDPDLGETLSYLKISGPTWLTVASNGNLSGTPTTAHLGSNIFTVSATDSAGASAQVVLTIQVTSGDSDANDNGIEDSWEITKFGNANLGANLPELDPDSDGLMNLMEFALDTHPLVANKKTLIVSFHTLPSGDHLRLQVSKNPLATNLVFIVEVCGDFQDWSSNPTTIESETATELIVRDNVSNSNSNRRFIRLKVRKQ
jgi:autotransporter-associated beta strand protein